MSKKYSIVEFEDSLQIIPNNWFTCEKKSTAYWPNLTNQKEYDKAVEKMKEYNNINATIVSIKRIFGSTDLNSDEDDAEIVKKRRRLYATKVLSSSSEEEIDNLVTNKKIDNYPKVPQISKDSNKSRRMLQDKENCPSEQENETQHARFEQNYNFSSNIHQTIKDSQNVHRVSNQNVSCGNISNVQHDTTDSRNVQRMSNQNVSCSRSISNVQHDTTGFDEFKHHIYRSLSPTKTKLDLILQNQLDFHEQWQNDNTRRIPNEDDDVDVMLQFPIETDNSLNQLEEALIDNNYRTKLVNKLSKIDGKNLRQLVLNLMKRIFAVTVAKEYSWYGKKQNKTFSDLKLCSVIISAIQVKYPQATEYEISEPIKSWLRHASEKAQKMNAAGV